LYVGLGVYAVASALFFLTGSAAGGALLWIPILGLILTMVLVPLVFAGSMLWGIAPIDFASAKWMLKRHYRWIVGAMLLASVALSLWVAASS
jgi:hypothetical protein